MKDKAHDDMQRWFTTLIDLEKEISDAIYKTEAEKNRNIQNLCTAFNQNLQ